MADISLASTSDTSFAISIDDTSPTVLYTPFGDNYGVPNLTAGWSPYFSDSGFATDPAAGQQGDGTSFHVTSADGASLRLRWNGECAQYSFRSSPFGRLVHQGRCNEARDLNSFTKEAYPIVCLKSMLVFAATGCETRRRLH